MGIKHRKTTLKNWQCIGILDRFQSEKKFFESFDFFILQSISNIGLVFTLFIGSSITKARQCKQSLVRLNNHLKQCLMRLKTISNEIKNNLQ